MVVTFFLVYLTHRKSSQGIRNYVFSEVIMKDCSLQIRSKMLITEIT